MSLRNAIVLRLSAGLLAVSFVTHVAWGDPPTGERTTTPGNPAADTPQPPTRVTVDEARRRARLLQQTYEITMRVIHRQYYEEDMRLAIPARAIEDIFTEVDRNTGSKTRWLAINTEAMNVDHNPIDEFEKNAVAALKLGKTEFELVENGNYRRVGTVTLGASCLHCHVSRLNRNLSNQRVAGFVMSIPIKSD